MEKEQKEVLALLKEIDALCRKHKITYYLSPGLTFCAEKTKELPQNPLCGMVLMKIPDMLRFAEVFDREKHPARVLESMRENPRFPGFYLRYTDTDTLCFQMKEGRSFQYPGMGIDIYPLRGKAPSKIAHVWNRVLETGWRSTGERYSQKPSLRAIVCGLVVRVFSLGGRKRLGNALYQRLSRNQDVPGTLEYGVYCEPRTLYYPAEIFEGTCEVSLSGERWMAPKEKERYLARTFGVGWQEREEEAYKPGMGLIVSARVGFEKYFAQVENPAKLLKAFRRQYLRDAIGRRRQRYLKRWWKYARLCADRRNAALYYRRNKAYLKNLYQCGDFVRMEAVFARYTKIMRRCLAEKEIYRPDDEIYGMYLEFLEKTGKTDLKKLVEDAEKRQVKR